MQTVSSAPRIEGQCLPGFEPVGETFAENFDKRKEVGAAFCAWYRGQKVVDLWGGWADPESKLSWQSDSLIPVFSATKGFVAVCLALLRQRGSWQPQIPLQTYWPAFQNIGDGAIQTGDLLNHRSGLCALDHPLDQEALDNREKILSALESQQPLWPPGSAQGYGAVTFGLYAGELVRRLSGRSVGRFLAEEVAGPWQADVFLGLPEQHFSRMAKLIPPGAKDFWTKVVPTLLFGNSVETRIYRAFLRSNSDTARAFANPADLGRRGLPLFNHPQVWQMELPWVNGIASARGLATLYAEMIGAGPSHPNAKLEPETLAALEKRQSWSRDRVLRKDMGYSFGFVKEEGHLYSPEITSFGHPGAGGSVGWADPRRNLAFGYVMNRMDHRLRSPRALALSHSLYRCL
ncbi:MAG: class A beta-lactamase-related serine hydrolase [Planctomycetota bacterium]|nr:MAG: class A beta-lactamase-related serine hydrolase [Planctomycetota bacterium]